jgi:hypothetical protein
MDAVPAGYDDIRLTVGNVLAASDQFAAHKAELKASGKFTDAGVAERLAEDLRKTFAARLTNGRKPLKALREKLDTLRSGVRPKPVDPGDAVGELKRQELRTFLRGAKPGERMKHALSNQRIAEAVLDAEPELSGLTPHDYATVREVHLKALFGPQLAEIEGVERALEAVTAAVEIADGEMKRTFGDPRGFDTIVTESKATPWLKKQGNGVDVIFQKDGMLLGRPATPDDLASGEYFANYN